MKKIIYFFIFVFCISFVYAQAPQIPTTQIYGSIDAPDGSIIIFERDGIEVGSGVVSNNQYGYDPVIFLDAETGDDVDVFVDDIFITTITLQKEGTVNIDITMPTAPPPEEEEEEEEPRSRRGGGLVIPAANYTASFSELPKTYNVRSRDKIFLTFKGAEHTIRITRLTYQNIELTISSTPSELNLNINDTGEVDLDDDGNTDISIIYQGVQENKGVIVMDQLEQPPAVQQPTSQPETEPETEPQSLVDTIQESEPEAPSSRFPWAAVVITIVILGILGGIGFVYYEMKTSHIYLKQEKAHGSLNQQSYARLQSYVKQTLEQGYTKAQIRQTLINEGWNQNTVNQVLR